MAVMVVVLVVVVEAVVEVVVVVVKLSWWFLPRLRGQQKKRPRGRVQVSNLEPTKLELQGGETPVSSWQLELSLAKRMQMVG